MGCRHISECPLFPLLNASLRGWRDCYCDSDDNWRRCARYELSLSGRTVPITLLPSGANAQLLRPEPQPDEPDRQQSRYVRPARPTTDSAPQNANALRFESRPPQQSLPRPGPAQAQRSRSSQHPQNVPDPAGHQPGQRPGQRPERQPGQRPRPARPPWWTRLIDWLAGPV